MSRPSLPPDSSADATRERRQPRRRDFLRTGLLSGLSLLGAPSILRARGTSDRVRFGGIGVGGKGAGDIHEVSRGHDIIALCDIDAGRLAKARKRYLEESQGRVKAFRDWRRLLDSGEIDAVTISTPDHMHATIALEAMARGLHVYVQKPIAHDVCEARWLTEAAREHGVVTQMGNQNHSGANYRNVVAALRSGLIGRVREAHAWSNRPVWPQGMKERPAGGPAPESIAWNEWLGGAPPRAWVKEIYHPFKWRGWLDFGTGALGDMGCHIIDPVVWALELDAPNSIRSEGPAPTGESYPTASTIRYEFGATRFTAPSPEAARSADSFSLTWYDGGRQPPRDLVPGRGDRKMPANGSLFLGEKGVLLAAHKGRYWLLPEEDFEDAELPDLEGLNHYQQWTRAILGEEKTTTHFDVSGPLTETVLLGNAALHFPGVTLPWDSRKLKFPSRPEAERFLDRSYREGWTPRALAARTTATERTVIQF